MIDASEALLAANMSRKRLISDAILTATSQARTNTTISITLTKEEKNNILLLGYKIKERSNTAPYGNQTIFDWSKAK